MGGLAGLFLLAGPIVDLVNAFRHPAQSEQGVCRVLSLVDGDTIRLWCPETGTETVRLTGFDAPESFSPGCLSELWAGQRATWAIRRMIFESEELKVVRFRRYDRYDRMLGQLVLDGVSLHDKMINEGYARPYDGGRRRGWCD